jgi:D5 N terminal like
MDPRTQQEQMHRTLMLLSEPGDAVEVRMLFHNGTDADISRFSDREKLVEYVSKQSAFEPKGVYITLNALTSELCKGSAKDSDISYRRNLLIDIDATRPAEVSSTEEEHQATLAKARQIRDALTKAGWPLPVLGDSGNGAHLIYRLGALQNNGYSRALVAGVLKALDKEYSDGTTVVDTAVFNASRISKLYGTRVRKGDDTPERPHRFARIIQAPDVLDCVTESLLRELAGDIKQENSSRPKANLKLMEAHAAEVEFFMRRHTITLTAGPLAWEGGFKWQLHTCPFNPGHKGTDAFVYATPTGYGFSCSHNSCKGKRWREFQEAYEPFRKCSPESERNNTDNEGTHTQETTTMPIPDLLLQGGETTFNDTGNAERIRLYAQGKLIYSKNERAWYVFDGRRFERNDMAAQRMATKAMQAFLRQSVDAGSDFRKFAVRCLDNGRIEHALSRLKNDVAVDITEFDKDHHLLSFLNGTVDLRTGELREHRQSDRITKLVPHNYVPGASARTFEKFLGEILPEPTQSGETLPLRNVNDPTIIECLQTVLGCGLTGDTSPKVVVIAHGASGNNGKSTLLEAVRRLIPEHSAKLMIDSLMVKYGGEDGNAKSDLADLCGARFVITSETESGQRLN